MWDLPGPGIELESPALAGRFFTTEPPGKPKKQHFKTKTCKAIENKQIQEKIWGFPDGSVVKNLPANAGDMGSIPGPGRSHMPQSK